MNRTAPLLFLVACLLFFTAHRLPAPISEPTPEETKAKPQAAPAKHKSVESSESNSARRFDGTWNIVDKTTAAGAVYTTSATLIIKDGKTADATTEITGTINDPRGWGDLPEAYKHSPVSYKYTNHSDHLVADGSDLMIRWSGRRLIDWAPKAWPFEEVAQKAVRSNEVKLAAFTLKGDELVFGKYVYHRVK